jgi:hypothetical protein
MSIGPVEQPEHRLLWIGQDYYERVTSSPGSTCRFLAQAGESEHPSKPPARICTARDTATCFTNVASPDAETISPGAPTDLPIPGYQIMVGALWAYLGGQISPVHQRR